MDINVEQQNALTLRVLRKTDGAIVEICARASFVSVYTFDSATSQWVRRGRLCRCSSPRCS